VGAVRFSPRWDCGWEQGWVNMASTLPGRVDDGLWESGSERGAEHAPADESAPPSPDARFDRDETSRLRSCFWFADARLILLISPFVIVALMAAMFVTGLAQFVDDPESALARRRQAQPTDFSWGVELRVIPDRPIGLEFRKIGDDEQIVIFNRQSVASD
jgi:hypothetical protein